MAAPVAVDKRLFLRTYAEAMEMALRHHLTVLDVGIEAGGNTEGLEGMLEERVPITRWRRQHARGEGAEVLRHGEDERRMVAGERLAELADEAEDVTERVAAGLERLWRRLLAAAHRGDAETARSVMVGTSRGDDEQRGQALRDALLGAIPAAVPPDEDLGRLRRWAVERIERLGRQRRRWVVGRGAHAPAAGTAQETAAASVEAIVREQSKAARIAQSGPAVRAALQQARERLAAVEVAGAPRLQRTNGAALNVDPDGTLYVGVAPSVRAIRFRTANPSDGSGVVENESPPQAGWEIETIGAPGTNTRIRASWTSHDPPTAGAHPLVVEVRNDTGPARYALEIRVENDAPSFGRPALPTVSVQAGQQVDIQFEAVTGGNGASGYTCAPIPPGLEFNGHPDSRTLSGVFAADQAGTDWEVTCVATDADGDEAEQSVTISVRPPDGG